MANNKKNSTEEMLQLMESSGLKDVSAEQWKHVFSWVGVFLGIGVIVSSGNGWLGVFGALLVGVSMMVPGIWFLYRENRDQKAVEEHKEKLKMEHLFGEVMGPDHSLGLPSVEEFQEQRKGAKSRHWVVIWLLVIGMFFVGCDMSVSAYSRAYEQRVEEQKAEKEREKAEREAEKEQERIQRDEEKEAKKAEKERERAEREAEKERERAEREAEKERERAEREAEKERERAIQEEEKEAQRLMSEREVDRLEEERRVDAEQERADAAVRAERGREAAAQRESEHTPTNSRIQGNAPQADGHVEGVFTKGRFCKEAHIGKTGNNAEGELLRCDRSVPGERAKWM